MIKTITHQLLSLKSFIYTSWGSNLFTCHYPENFIRLQKNNKKSVKLNKNRINQQKNGVPAVKIRSNSQRAKNRFNCAFLFQRGKNIPIRVILWQGMLFFAKVRSIKAWQTISSSSSKRLLLPLIGYYSIINKVIIVFMLKEKKVNKYKTN